MEFEFWSRNLYQLLLKSCSANNCLLGWWQYWCSGLIPILSLLQSSIYQNLLFTLISEIYKNMLSFVFYCIFSCVPLTVICWIMLYSSMLKGCISYGMLSFNLLYIIVPTIVNHGIFYHSLGENRPIAENTQRMEQSRELAQWKDTEGIW